MNLNYADAINLMVQERQQRRDYGGFLAQAGVPLEEAPERPEPWSDVVAGYAEQLHAYPEG